MENFKFIEKIDIFKLKTEILNLPNDEWLKNTSRQDSFVVHSNTVSLILKDFPNDWEGIDYPLTEYFIDNDIINKETDILIKKLEDLYNGKVGKVVFAKLLPESFIKPHVDSGYYLTHCHRFHIPILTNDFVHFFAGNEWMILEEGDLYEFNNNVMHSVVNYSMTPRIHLIIDIVPKGCFV
jgi:hypothetical protein